MSVLELYDYIKWVQGGCMSYLYIPLIVKEQQILQLVINLGVFRSDADGKPNSVYNGSWCSGNTKLETKEVTRKVKKGKLGCLPLTHIM